MNLSPKAKQIKAKTSKLHLIKFKSFCTTWETTGKTKRQPRGWKKIFADDVIDRGPISKVYKQLIQLKIKKKKPIKNWAEYLNRHFSKEDIQMANSHVKRCSTSLIRDITVRYHLTLKVYK